MLIKRGVDRTKCGENGLEFVTTERLRGVAYADHHSFGRKESAATPAFFRLKRHFYVPRSVRLGDFVSDPLLQLGA